MPARWTALRVAFDRDLSIDDLPPRIREDIYAAIRKYSQTGVGGTVAMRAPGSPEYDILIVSGYEAEFRVYRDDDDPTMFVFRVERHDGGARSEDD